MDKRNDAMGWMAGLAAPENWGRVQSMMQDDGVTPSCKESKKGQTQ